MWPGAVDLSCLYGAQTDWTNSTVIVPAVYREWHGRGPPAWLAEQYPVYLYQRRNASASCYCANHGYESGVYFTFVARHYLRLPKWTAFVQGDWIFSSKTSAGGPFRFWQPRCAAATAARALPWAEYMPLGGRRTAWPPRCVIRQTSFYGRFVGKRNGVVVEACVRELLRLAGWSGALRPYDAARPLNITFYTNMNFLASRSRLRRYTHRAYRQLASRFIDANVCVPPSATSTPTAAVATDGGRGGGGLAAIGGVGEAVASEALAAHPGVFDKPEFSKFTLGMATELLQQSLFGDGPLEDGPPPLVPKDGEHCEEAAVSRCSIGS